MGAERQRKRRQRCRVELTSGERFRGVIIGLSHTLRQNGETTRVYEIETDDPAAWQKGRRFVRDHEIVGRY